MTTSIREFVLRNGLFIEASAGTGKTYTVSALVTREIALRDDLRIGELLITTFTRNAAAELRDRVRRRLVDALRALETGEPVENDDLVAHLLEFGPDRRVAMRANLRRAVVEFDTATISTIHAICARILAIAGLPSGSGAESDSRDLVIHQKVNDLLAGRAMTQIPVDQARLARIVSEALSSPDAELWIDPVLDSDVKSVLAGLKDDIIGAPGRNGPTGLVEQVRDVTKEKPTYDDLLHRAAEVVVRGEHEAALAAIRDRFRIVFVDEAQDTDPLQWSIFKAIVHPMATERILVVVGDPKQSIYRFRGADISAYMDNRDEDNLETLDQNHRSDGDLVDSLNLLLDGQTYGHGVAYVHVGHPEKNAGRRIGGVEPVEVMWIGKADGDNKPSQVAVGRVADLLARATIESEPVRPSDICVLVRSNEIGGDIENQLKSSGIPAVSGGTASVMKGEAARALGFLFLALDRPHHVGLVRQVLGTFLFGRPPASGSVLADGGIDDELELIGSLARTLRSRGVAAVRAALLNHPPCAHSILASRDAERRITDINHIIDLLHDRTGGRGTDAGTVLQHLADLAALDSTAELVARRVESDLDAVSILTIHAAKGLEFPVVVVADKWTEKKARDQVTTGKTADQVASDRPPVFLGEADSAGRRRRRIDLSWVLTGVPSPTARLAAEAEDKAEMARQFYVAMTRAKHHVTVLLPSGESDTSIGREFINEDVVGIEGGVTSVTRVLDPPAHHAPPRPRPVEVAPFDSRVEQTYIRTSFSAITDTAGARGSDRHGAPGHGNDEDSALFEVITSYADQKVPNGTDSMRLARLTGGTHLGTVIHDILEDFVPGDENPRQQFDLLVERHARGPSFTGHRSDIAAGLTVAVTTDLGPFMGHRTLNTIPASDRLAELGFEMGLPHLDEGVDVRAIGRVLLDLLPADDVLRPYAQRLVSDVFAVPLAGLINGSIDAVLRINSDHGPRFFITDYKSNRLDTDGDATLIDAYAPARLLAAMEHHHYPLQALIYGTAFHRFLRWKDPTIRSDDAIAGIAYFFLRGMVGDPALVDPGSGCPHGVFQWQAPEGLWSALSDVLSGGGQ